jgi:hypothetical protein
VEGGHFAVFGQVIVLYPWLALNLSATTGNTTYYLVAWIISTFSQEQQVAEYWYS